jgi:hypothetical protein
LCEVREATSATYGKAVRAVVAQGAKRIAPQRPSGLAQAGLPLPLARAQNFQITTNFQASHCPACAKPPVIGRSIRYFPHFLAVISSLSIFFLQFRMLLAG